MTCRGCGGGYLAGLDNWIPCDCTETSASDVERLVMREQECRKHIERYTQIKLDMMNVSIPEITVYPDGKVETKYNWTPEQEKVLDLADEAIKSIIKSYGFTTAQR